VIGGAAPSIFTASITDGLQTGAADIDGDGLVSVDDVHEYARRRLAEQPRRQSPRKWEFDVAGAIVLARSPGAADPAVSSQPGARRVSPCSCPPTGRPQRHQP
jgi:hypothetical protein